MADAAKTIVQSDESGGDEPTQLISDSLVPRGELGRESGSSEFTFSLDFQDPVEMGDGRGSLLDETMGGEPADSPAAERAEVGDVFEGRSGAATELEFGFGGSRGAEPEALSPPEFGLTFDASGPADPLMLAKSSDRSDADARSFDGGQQPEQPGDASLPPLPQFSPASAEQAGAGQDERAPIENSTTEPTLSKMDDAPLSSPQGYEGEPLSVPISDALIPPPGVEPPASARGNRFAFLINAYHSAGKGVAVGVAFLALFVFASPYIVGEEQLRVIGQSLGAELLFESLGLIGTGDQVVPAQLPAASAPTKKPEPNAEYFNRISEVLRQGDRERAATLMKEKPQALLETAFDLDKAASLSARFYLSLGNDEQALRAAMVRCGDSAGSDIRLDTCLPLVRAYVSLGQFDDAARALARLEGAKDAGDFADQVGYVKAALGAGLAPTPRSLANQVLSFLEPAAMVVEWERQNAAWILHGFARLGNRRWRDIAQILFQIDRAEAEAAIGRADIDGARYRNAYALTRFLDFLALRFGYPVLGFKHGSSRLAVDDIRLAATFEVLSRNMSAEVSGISNGLYILRGKRPFAEVEHLIAVNLAIQEKSWNKAYQILSGQVEEIPRSRFGFEWKLAGAAFAIGSNNVLMARDLERALTLYGAKESKVKATFDYWYTLARLRINLRMDVGDAITRASSLADAEREQGLVEALKLASRGTRIEAGSVDIDGIVKRYPWHDSVLEAAILAAGRMGRDPARFMAMQNRLTPVRLAAGREKNLLLDSTVEELLKQL